MTDPSPILDADATSAPGFFEVDGSGRILSADDAAVAIVGAPSPASVSGSHLFRDVMPAASVPAFLGRFAAGVRAGSLADRFVFVLGRETGSLELDVRLENASAPGTYRVTLTQRRALEPSRQREAMLTVNLRAQAEEIDPSVCEREPIHLVGSIQAQGALLAIDPGSERIVAASANIGDVVGVGHADVVGRPLAAILQPRLASVVATFARNGTRPSLPRRVEILGSPPRPFEVFVHAHDGRVIVELEAAPAQREDFDGSSHAATRDAVQRLRIAPDVASVSATATTLLREMTGFERVLIYRFDAEWNGEALAESIVSDWDEQLLGLRFPASDIPRQARELYRHSPSRYVVDRDATPVPVVGLEGGNQPLDLGRAVFRSLSPVHMEYQRNLGVNGSMSVAILIDGRLWGLAIGHHRRPHYVAPETRDAVTVVVDALALRIHDLQTAAVAADQARYLSVQLGLLRQMAEADDVVTALDGGPVRLTDLFGATGAAIVQDDVATTTGQAPSPAEVVALAGWLRDTATDDGLVSFDNLGEVYPPAAAHAEIASGLLAAFFGGDRQNVLIWFRPEVASTVVWSGDPRKTVLFEPSTAAVLPRRSFERWVEERGGHSLPWTTTEIEIARTLANAVEGVVLRQSRRVRELSASSAELRAALDQKERLLEQKDLLTREIDHRVKNSLQIVSAFLLMQSRSISDPTAKQAFTDTYGRVMSVARVHDSLYQSDDVAEVDLGQTIEALTRDLSTMGGDMRGVEVVAEGGVMVPYRKAVALCLIATELVTNSFKYAYGADEPGGVAVKVDRRDEGGLRMRVCDQGGGLPGDWSSRPRKGLGMQLIRTLLKQIDATMDVESGNGTCFTVLC